jgi:hypothetical protein
MKTRNTLIIIATVMIVFNALSYVSGKPVQSPGDILVDRTAYLIGYNIFFIIAALLLIIAFFVHRRVIRKRKMKMIDSFLNQP